MPLLMLERNSRKNGKLSRTVIHVPPGHPETMKRTGAANVQLMPVSSDLSVAICAIRGSNFSLKIDPGPSKRAAEFLKLSNVSA